jgi:hypothetical protein
VFREASPNCDPATLFGLTKARKNLREEDEDDVEGGDESKAA